MSADNWTDCPNCLKKRTLKKQTHEDLLKVFYGKVTVDEYLAMSKNPRHPKFNDAVPTFDEDSYESGSLREDYHQGITYEGNYVVEYHCSCEVCGFRWEFKHEVDDITDSASGRR